MGFWEDDRFGWSNFFVVIKDEELIIGREIVRIFLVIIWLLILNVGYMEREGMNLGFVMNYLNSNENVNVVKMVFLLLDEMVV